ncbi:MAG: sorbosone dehydrogenase family protein [Acetobacteraceae bacterium]|nr:sorbosone dehydrogenase family protein [Acetobacteraceae bacterium]
MRSSVLLPIMGLLASLLASCGERAALPASAGFGPTPALPGPRKTLFPTVLIAPARGWAPGETPTAASGLRVSEYVGGLQHPRWLYLLPNGDVLVAETNTPPQRALMSGLRGVITRLVMGRAGAGVPSANRITLLRGVDASGAAQFHSVFLEGLNSPFGMALVGRDLYVADTDALLRFPYKEGQTRITAPGVKITDLPAGPINYHWTKNLIASHDGSRLYVSVGSNSNAGERGLAAEEGRAAIWEIDPRTGQHRLFASGLRNPVGMDWEPYSGALWVAVNERDELGSDTPPDYMTAVRDGGFYGWPYSYFGGHLDDRVKPQRPDLVARAIVPDYALGAHTASLGLAFSRPGLLPERFWSGAFIGQHGSWNRRPRTGYKVVFVPFAKGRPAGLPLDVLTGFLDAQQNARGRPVGVAMDMQGALLVADDVGNKVWRVTGAVTEQAPR